MEEKTEKPTLKKVKDARKKGQVARSKEVVSLALMLTALFWVVIDGERVGKKMESLLSVPPQLLFTPFEKAVESAIVESFVIMMEILSPFLILVFFVAIFSNIFQFGPLFSPDAINPDFKKLNPISGAKNIFSKKNFVDFILSTLKILTFSVVLILIIISQISDIVKLPYVSVDAILPVSSRLIVLLSLFLTIPLFVISVLDLLFQRYNHEKELKMSKDEVKREYKDNEGSPEIKQERKKFYKDIQSGSMLTQLDKTSVVIANPTHLVVGVYYERNSAPIPVISFKYKGYKAREIKRLAEDEKLPIIDNIMLARGLYSDAELYQPIPKDHFAAMAEIIKWLQTLDDN
ncbi:type III secretion system export apparatus subunit SctU [Vibrio sp. TBV020]|uniref:type III secretion system export apparatus subunit SctU n=1 Tax=Vibrio sp. TBV020 TaxID=3137398 RepID=UPI0038CDB6EC